MRVVEIAGRKYRLFFVASIHEEANYVECRAMDTGDCVCEIRMDSADTLSLMPTLGEIDVNVVVEAIAYAKEVAHPSDGASSD
ncbi:hypothetical protein [Streptomyces shenzhenensis]|uniref:hypothetical protein n=1 Tax=Streptomyces shenzhenensis TaxID=943815 RepID=UPI0011C42856|nr:hypothetical protein [Streptomyces shenzhenensis]